MSGYLILTMLCVLLIGTLAGLASRLRAANRGLSHPFGAARVTSRGKVLRTTRRRSLAYWRRG